MIQKKIICNLEGDKNKFFKFEKSQYDKKKSYLDINQNKKKGQVKLILYKLKFFLYNNNLFDISNKYKAYFEVNKNKNLNEVYLLNKKP